LIGAGERANDVRVLGRDLLCARQRIETFDGAVLMEQGGTQSDPRIHVVGIFDGDAAVNGFGELRMPHSHVDVCNPEAREMILGMGGCDFLHCHQRLGVASRLRELNGSGQVGGGGGVRRGRDILCQQKQENRQHHTGRFGRSDTRQQPEISCSRLLSVGLCSARAKRERWPQAARQ